MVCSEPLHCITLHYKHFIRFSELVWGCLQFEMPRDRLPGLRKEFAERAQDFEK